MRKPYSAYLELILSSFRDELSLMMHYRGPRNAALDSAGPFPVALNLEKLTSLTIGVAEYGEALTEQLFAHGEARRRFTRYCDTAFQEGNVLRIQLHLSDPQLHNLYWETLQHPDQGYTLALERHVLVSRLLPMATQRAVTLRLRRKLRALVAVAAPINLAIYGLSNIDAASELERLRAGFSAVECDVLPKGTTPCTLEAITERLRDGEGYDIFCLMAHGRQHSDSGVPHLFLEDEARQTALVSGEEIAQAIKLADGRQPRLVVLASCESAGSSYGDAAAALGSLLFSAGVPVVLAMRERVQIATVERLLPAFFSELLRDGMAERALAVARLAAREEWWKPVLYTRLEHGRIWEDWGTAPLSRSGVGRGAIDEHALADLLERTADAPFTGDELDKAYPPSAYWLHDFLPIPRSLAEMIQTLNKAPFPSIGPHPLVEFASNLAVSAPTPALGMALRGWAAAVGAVKQPEPPPAQQPLTAPYLLVYFEPSTLEPEANPRKRTYDMTCHLWSQKSPPEGKSVAASTHSVTIPEARAKLEALLHELTRRGGELYGDTRQLTIAFCLPQQLLDEDVAGWAYRANPTTISQLGVEYHVVVRPAERLDKDWALTFDECRQRWQLLERLWSEPSYAQWRVVFWPEAPYVRLYEYLKSEEIVGLMLIERKAMGSRKRGDELKDLIASGTPFAIWARRPLSAEELRLSLEDLLKQAPPTDTNMQKLLDAIRRLRREARSRDDPTHIGSRLVLMLDNPRRLPPKISTS